MQHALADIVKQLHAGAELDDLLARYVMGWDRVMGPENDHWWTRLSRTGNPISTPVIKVSQWRPTEDLSQAHQVLEACQPGISRDGAGRYFATSLWRSDGAWTVALDENEMGPTQVVSADTFQVAVGRAAVAWALRKELESDRLEHGLPIEVPGNPVSEQLREERR